MLKEPLLQVVDLPLKDKAEVITYLCELSQKEGLVNNKEAYQQAVFEREALVSTAVGYGIAIPHGESDAVCESFVACLKLVHPICWDTQEDTRFVFMIGVPLKNRQKEHLRILATLSRCLMRKAFREQLEQVKTSHELSVVLSQIEEEMTV